LPSSAKECLAVPSGAKILSLETMISFFNFSLFPEDHEEPIKRWIKYKYGGKKKTTQDTIISLQNSLLKKLQAGKDIINAINDTISNPDWKGLTFVENRFEQKQPKKTMRDVNDKKEEDMKF
jgi:hypothetical protein